jgi:hypothetical protein
VKVCSVEGCGRKYVARGYCALHYAQKHKAREFDGTIKERRSVCCIDGCNNKHWQHGYCKHHFNKLVVSPRKRKTWFKCLCNDCDRKTQHSSHLCAYHRMIKYGDNKGEHNGNWKGGTSQYKNHYLMKKLRLIKLNSTNYKCEICGREAEEVHHLDKNKTHHELSNFVAVCRKCHLSFYHRNEIGRKPKFCQYTCAAIASFTGLSSATVNKYFHNNASQKTITIIESFLNQEHKEAI